MDLQNFLIQKPTPIRDYKVTPSVSYTTAYPAALVPGQFSEFYEKYTPEQLAWVDEWKYESMSITDD